ncbi:MAG: hypothetical protein HXS50_03885 [Theionarchaea archaeon]|nr:hypothetical protein [Theionarchaea archaeon]
MSVWHSLPEMKARLTILLNTSLLDLLRYSAISDDSIIRSTNLSRVSFSFAFATLIWTVFTWPRVRKTT